MLIAFVGLILVVFCLLHFYLWKRLVQDPFRSRRARSVGTVVAALLTFLAPATLIGVRSGYVEWLAWPGYLWIALMFYLFVTLLALEIPRLVINLWIRTTSKRAARAPAPVTASPAAPVETSTTPTNPAATTSAAATSANATADSTTAGNATTIGTTPGTATPGTATPGNATTIGTTPGTATPGTATPGTATPSNATPGTATPGTATPGTATPSNATPGTATASGAESDGSAPGGSTAQELGINRRLLLARGAAIFAGLTAAGVTGYGVKTALGPPQLDRVQLPLAKLPRAMDGTRLAVVSDIHLGPLTGTNHAARIVGLINSVNADVVCIVGDLVDGSVAELGRFAAPLAGIESRRGAYFVTGNHEYYSGFQEWVDEVARLGIRPLRNERLSLDGLDLAGVNDIGGEEFGDGPDLQRALGDRDTGRPVVLMAHQPVVARDAAPFGVDLQVSGHTHGGQMAPFNLLVQLEQPVVSGLGKVDGVPVYVTNGAGFWGPPVRVGAPPQVTVIELRTP